MTRLFLVALLLLVTPVTQAPPMGAAIVSGTVVTTDRPAVPVARAEITLSGGATGPTRKTLTDEAGAFRFDRVAVGQYTLTASKAGYATGSFGSTQSTAAGVPIVVSAGSALTGIVLELTRAGAISGVVRDRHGGPIARIDVQLLRLAFKQGARAAAPVGKPVTTDDRGQYRFSGLAPGEYFVSIPARFANYNFGGATQTTAADVERAKQLLAGKQPAASESAELVSYPPTFYPSATSLSTAVPLRVASGAERAGADVIVAPKPVLNLSGSIVAPGGGPGTDLKFWALADDVSGNDKSVPGSAAKPDGSFLVPAVFPGRHVLHARATVGVTGGIRASSPTHWARLEVDARDMNLTSLVMTLEPMLTISGRVRVDAGGAGDQIGSIGISLMDADQTVFFEVPGAKTLPDGTFTLTGVAPARYRLLASGASDLTIKGITAGSALDLADALIDLRAGAAPPSLDVVLTRQTTELTGSLRDAASRPVSNYTIVAFAPDRRYWTGHTRRVQATRAATDGSFRFSNLPAGEYLMAAVTDVEDGQWLDPSWLAELVPHGVRVVVPDGGKVVQNLQVR